MGTPNIVIFFVDDLGYGDISALNVNGKIQTPNVDRLAREGMVFTDAHSTSAVCSPSRYGLLTGRYNWRTTLQAGIVRHYGDPLIDEDRLTLPGLLGQKGYRTGCIGKWHLGMGWDFEISRDFLPTGDEEEPRNASGDLLATEAQKALWRQAFSKPTLGGPTTRGFDYYFGVDVPNWPPYCFIDGDSTVGTPSEFLPSRLLVKNQASTPGPAMPYWNFEQLLPTWAQKADEFIAAGVQSEKPFLLYLPMTSPHTPLAVNAPFIGSSGLNNLYADLVVETDDILGRVLTSLARYGVEDETIVIFTSDNGCAPYIGVDELEAQGHFPSAWFRGYKSDAWDGGHRIPLILRWPRVVQPGSSSGQLVCLTDLFSTCAEIAGVSFPDDAGEDSVSLMSILEGEDRGVRDVAVHHSISGKFAIRDARWKLVLCPGSGGWTKRDSEAIDEGLPLVQLYDMVDDPGESTNLYRDRPQQVRAMIRLLEETIRAQPNDVDVDMWKLDTMPGVTEADVKAFDDY